MDLYKKKDDKLNFRRGIVAGYDDRAELSCSLSVEYCIVKADDLFLFFFFVFKKILKNDNTELLIYLFLSMKKR